MPRTVPTAPTASPSVTASAAPLPSSDAATPAPAALALHDARPFFEKALLYGVAQGILNTQRLAAMQAEAPKGMVQIARYFGSEFLRPELEKARQRMVNMVSLHLEHHCAADLRSAAELLRDHSLLSRSKAGADMLKALIAMPQSSHFGLYARGGFTEDDIPQLAQWSLRSLAQYQAELAKRAQAQQRMDAAQWFAAQADLDMDDLEDPHCDADAIVRTALLLRAGGQRSFLDAPGLHKWLLALRKKAATQPEGGLRWVRPEELPAQLPAALHAVVLELQASVRADLPTLLDPATPPKRLLMQTPAFMGRYFWLEDPLAEVDAWERERSPVWDKATGGRSDDGTLLTVFLTLAAGGAAKTLLTTKSATALLRKLQKAGLQAERAYAFIREHAPAAYQSAHLRMAQEFFESLQDALEHSYGNDLRDALALLRSECHLTGA